MSSHYSSNYVSAVTALAMATTRFARVTDGSCTREAHDDGTYEALRELLVKHLPDWPKMPSNVSNAMGAGSRAIEDALHKARA